MNKINKLIIAKDGWPLEQITGHPIINFIRRLLHSKEVVCRDCWYANQAAKTSYANLGVAINLRPTPPVGE